MRLFPAALALLLAACASPDASPADTPADDFPHLGTEASTPEADPPRGFDAQAWLADAREVAVGVEGAGLDDPETDRMKELAGDLNEAADWRRACDTYSDYETGEEVYDPIPPGEGHWARGTMEVAAVSETEAVVAVTCDFGAYQGSYAFVHIAGDRVALLTAPTFDDDGQPTGPAQGTFGTPDFSRVSDGLIATFSRARGLGDCGIYVLYAMGKASPLSVREVRERDCGSDIPDDLPPPEEWSVVYTAQ